MKKETLQASYEKLELDFKYKEMKQSFILQKEKWQSLYSFYIEPLQTQ
jgi:stearoyl-CoA desaturase (delta-9 desaturase)